MSENEEGLERLSRAEVAHQATEMLHAFDLSLPVVTERQVRFYQERRIVDPALGGTRGASYTRRHALQVAVAVLHASLPARTLATAANETRLPDAHLEEALRRLGADRQGQAPNTQARPLPHLRGPDRAPMLVRSAAPAPRAMEVEESSARVYHLGRDVRLIVPSTIGKEDLAGWIAERIRSLGMPESFG